ncbi:MAG: SIS domain-containing protein [Candidatus Nitrosopelagicus sp.]|nr:SIS domain-containing protein [Candidatus Nitrosopelagicus sp.]
MCDAYDKWPEIARNCYENDFPKLNLEKKIDNIIFVGMGGSGTVGDVISSVLSKTNIHVSVTKGYVLPKTVDDNTLIVITSVSGNTDENLTVLKNSIKTNAKTITFSSGGKLKELSNNNNIIHYEIPQFHSPRASFTSFLYTTLSVLDELLPIKKNEVEQSINFLEKTRLQISSSNLSNDNPSIKLAEWISDIPVIYYPCGLQAVAIRFKNSLQENAKTHVITEDVIEACHNGVVSWEGKQTVKPILIQGTDDNIKTKERWKVFEEFFNSRNISFYRIVSLDGSIISKITNMIYLLDYSSIYYAILNGVDPSPVNSIDYFKNRISSNIY